MSLLSLHNALVNTGTETLSPRKASPCIAATLSFSSGSFWKIDCNLGRASLARRMPTVTQASRLMSLLGESSKSTSLGPESRSLILERELSASRARSGSEECAAATKSGTAAFAIRIPSPLAASRDASFERVSFIAAIRVVTTVGSTVIPGSILVSSGWKWPAARCQFFFINPVKPELGRTPV